MLCTKCLPELLAHRCHFVLFPCAPNHAIICIAPYVGPFALSKPEKKKTAEIAKASGIFQTKREIFFVAPSSAVDLFRGVQEFGQDVTAMMSLADRLLCLLWSLPLCLGAPVGI
jgi:hypothetical protein